MKTWIAPMGLLRRTSSRRPSGSPRADDTGALASVGRVALARRTAERRTVERAACDRLLGELTSSALLVSRGVATRVVVCNAPGSIDFDEVRLIADRFDVAIEPVVRVGGGGFDFAVARREPTDG